MYKLILVDDEEEVRKGIIKKINWNEHGFEIAGEAENGKEALEIAEKVIPDVVITDIKMPFMNGIALAEQLRKKLPSTKVVILTGFDEFEYAQKAIKLNVIEYVLKPISSIELTDVLQKVKSKMDAEIAQREDIQALKEHYTKSLPILREKFLALLINGKLKNNEIKDKARNYGISLQGKNFLVSVLSIDSNNSCDKMQNKEQVLIDDYELLTFAAFNIAEEITKKHELGILFICNENIVIISFSDEEFEESLSDRTLLVLDEIRMYIQKYFKVTVTAGVGDIYNDISGVSTSYRNAISALDYRVVLGNNRTICIGDVEPQIANKAVFDELKAHSLICALKVGTETEIRNVLESVFEEFISSNVSYKDYQLYLLEILTTILKVAKDLAIDTDDIFGINYNLFTEMYSLKEIQGVKEWFIGICIKITGYISKNRQDNCKLLIKEATDYIQNNYHNSELTIDRVCKHLHISPAYFSTIFKKETKLTFVNYLTHIRMEAAKELLRTTDLKTFEIAEKIGYTEPNYFSFCFKKRLNISPSEFRKNINQ